MLGQEVSPAHLAAICGQARGGQTWLDFDAPEFDAGYNRRPFLVHHRLAEHPRFQLEPLFALCRRLPKAQIHHRFGVIPPDADFDSSLNRNRAGLSLDDAIDHLEERQAYLAVYNPETDAEYRPVIEGLLGEVAVQTERREPGLNWYSTYIFITAKDSLTPYHMDREMNFLLQIRGSKNVQLWDPNDDEIMSPAERDRLLSRTDLPRPTYKPSFESKAMTFDLRPGLGVHHPFIAPHLVRTGNALSVSLSITFRTRRSDMWTDAHRLNQRLRGLGLEPAKIGERPWVNSAKASLLRVARQARRVSSVVTSWGRRPQTDRR